MSERSNDGPIARLAAAWNRLCVHRAVWMLVATGLVTLALAPGVGRMSEGSYRNYWFQNDDPALKSFHRFEKEFGNDDTLIVVVQTRDGIVTRKGLALVQRAQQALASLPRITRVQSLASYVAVQSKGDDVELQPLLPKSFQAAKVTDAWLAGMRRRLPTLEGMVGNFVSKDLKTAAIYGFLAPTNDPKTDYTAAYNALQSKLRPLRGHGDRLWVTGTATLNIAFREVSRDDLRRVIPVAIVAFLLVLAFILRDAAAVLIALTTVAITVVATYGFGGYIGIRFHILSSMVPTILLAVATADGIHLLTTFQRNLRLGDNRKQAMLHSLQINLWPTILTSVTTAVGFASLASSNIPPVRDLGILASFGVVAAWLFTFSWTVPWGLLLTYRRAPKARTEPSRRTDRIDGYLNGLQRWRRPILTVVVLCSLGTSALALRARVDSHMLGYFTDSVIYKKAYLALKNSIGGVTGFELVFDSGAKDGIKDPVFLHRVGRVLRRIAALPTVTSVHSALRLLRDSHRILDGRAVLPDTRKLAAQIFLLHEISLPPSESPDFWYSGDYRRLRASILWTRESSTEVAAGLAQVRRVLATEPALRATVTGKATLLAGLDSYILRTFGLSLALALLGVSLFLAIWLRSISAGLLTLLPNILPLIFGIGFLVAMGRSLDVGSMLVGSVCLGIAVDDTIYVFSHLQSARARGATYREGLHHVFDVSGRALVGTTVLLVTGFGAFALGQFEPNRSFGMLTALVLGVALFFDVVVIPAFFIGRVPRAEAGAEAQAHEAN